MEKGTYGYGIRKLKIQILKMSACYALVIGAFVIGLILTGTRKNILTVGAICSVLPAATFTVNVIARLKGLPLKKQDYENFEKAAEGQVTACDMIVTANQKLVPIQAAVFHEHGITAYTASKKTDLKQAERDLNGLSKSVGIYAKIRLFGDFEAFLKQTGAIQEPENEEKKEELRQKRKAFLVYSM